MARDFDNDGDLDIASISFLRITAADLKKALFIYKIMEALTSGLTISRRRIKADGLRWMPVMLMAMAK